MPNDDDDLISRYAQQAHNEMSREKEWHRSGRWGALVIWLAVGIGATAILPGNFAVLGVGIIIMRIIGAIGS